MAQDSWLWTTGATGDGAAAYTQAKVILWQRQSFCGADNEGVLKNYLNELATTGASSPVATNTGGAYVYGFPYNNSTSVDTAIPTPSGNTRIDRLVLRANWSAQTVRITRIAGSEGTGNPPNIVQTDGTTWDNPLYQASITTGGVITLTDEREFLHPNIAVSMAMLDGILPQLYRRQGGSATDWFSSGTTTYTPSAVRMQAGVVEWTGSSTDYALVAVTFPVAFSYKPLVLCIAAFDSAVAAHRIITCIDASTITTTGVTLQWRSIEASNHTSVNLIWLAIGPE